ncbi:DUF5691 domain-containing protein [Asticcacaulis excentricus]|uniref:Uncharacterized protein n=1 Tax=Asticcacaulis excentricus (strain ATCC 15261 / DSM 4724 / KCTC 12464 / NCIMB 9791 / VKM B-1370 / CB 48) TaxID=573065 RepID=E8RKD6_ASTEC|nr:DUF5691 domain-containing protein [Asticcacaulis excentricus]ADU12416.1 hypothetical protein Astex_0731 [Asticcacaulis excentricus CB 48]
MSAQVFKIHLLPGLLSGNRDLALARAGVATSLQALALTAQTLRFDRPAMPTSFQVVETISDTRAIVPDAVRRPLIRLLTRKAVGIAPNAFPDAIARLMAARRLRLHPFDLAKLESFVRGYAEALGAEAAAFAQRHAPPEERRGYFETDALDETTWMLATPAARQAYIVTRRREDAAAGRVLVEGVWASEPADTRVRLLASLQEGLGSEDAPFLTSLNKDRAPRVREMAMRLLARLPGHEGDNPALNAVTGRLKSKQTGFLTKRTTLSLELPANVTVHSAPTWLVETFSVIGLDELARAVALTAAALPAAAEKDDNLLLALAVMATRDKRFDVLKGVVDHLPDVWEQLLRANFTYLDDYTPDERARWAQVVIRPMTWTQDAPLWSLVKLPAVLDGPASDALMADLLKARPWLEQLKDNSKLSVDLINVMASLSPPSHRAALRAQIAPLDPAKTADALTFLDIMDALEAPNV